MQGCGNQKPTGPVDDCCVSPMGLRVTGGGWVQLLMDNTIRYYINFVRIGDWRGSTFVASNHKSTRATPGSFASVLYL